MHKENEKSDEKSAVQNRFTAYLKRALHNGKIDLLYKGNPFKAEIPTDEIEHISLEDTDLFDRLAEYDALQQALRTIKDRERYVLLARVVENRDFRQIGKRIGLSGKGAAAVYYRTLEKLRRQIEGEENGF